MKNERILIISDTHFPYNHGDVIAFLDALNKKYKFDRVIHIGDEIDWHAISFHDHDPDLMSPGDELKTSTNRLQPLFRMFPKVDVLESNHGSLVYRKQKANGLPRFVIKSYREILGAPGGWRWRDELVVRLPDKSSVYFHHGKSSDVTRLSKNMGMNAVQGHYHEKFKIEHWINGAGRRFWAMQVGCLIERSSMAFAYARNNLQFQALGCGVIIESEPKLEPMIVDSKGRWVGRLA